MKQEPKLQWWGYLHSNGTLQLKRWLGDHADYTTDCQNNPFVIRVVKPFEAETQEEALRILSEKLIEKEKLRRYCLSKP